MAEEKKKADDITQAIYRKADAQLDEDVDELYKKICEFIIEHGAGAKVAFGTGVETNGTDMVTPRTVSIYITREGATSSCEVHVADIIKRIPEILRKAIQEPYRHKCVREFIGDVERIKDLEVWADEADGYINRG